MKKERKQHPKNRITYWRKLRKKTLDDVGKELGILKAGVSLKAKGESPVTLSDLYILAKLFKCSPWEIAEEQSMDDIISILENSSETTQQRFDDWYEGWKRRGRLKKIPNDRISDSHQSHKGHQ